jgi:hypothetical protein
MKIFPVYAALLLAATLMVHTGCGKKEGSAEKVGEAIDGTKDHPLRDALEPDGNGEKAGKKIDKGVDNLDKGLDKAGKKIDKAIDKAAN